MNLLVGASPLKIDTPKGSDGNADGFLMVSEHQKVREASSSFELLVWLLEGSKLVCWQGSLPLKDLKFLKHENEDDLRNQIISLLASKETEDDEKIQTQWSRGSSSGDDEDVLEVTMVDRRSGLKVVRWKGFLERQDSAKVCYNMLRSLHTQIVTIKDTLASNNTKHEQETQTLRRAVDDYRKTAEALEGVWEKEKTELLQNFLKAYNARADVLKQQAQEIQQIREQLAEAQTKPVSKKSSKTPGRPKQPDILDDVPEDVMDIDADTIDRLAGEKVAPKPTSKPATRTSPPTVKMRVNPITGVKEYTDADTAIDDAFGETETVGKNPTTTRTVKKEKEDGSQPGTRKRQVGKRKGGDEKKEAKTAAANDNQPAAKAEPKREIDSEDSASKKPPTKKPRRPIYSSSDSDSSGPAVRRRPSRAVKSEDDSDSSGPVMRKRSQAQSQSSSAAAAVKPSPVQSRRKQSHIDSSDTEDDSMPTRRNRKSQLSANRPSRATQRGQAASSSDTEDETPRKRPVKANPTPPKNDDDDDSATDDEMLNNIKSQIAMLKQQEEEESD